MLYPFTYTIRRDDGAIAFQIGLSARLEMDPESPGDWFVAAFLCEGLPLSDIGHSQEHQWEAILAQFLADNEAFVDAKWAALGQNRPALELVS